MNNRQLILEEQALRLPTVQGLPFFYHVHLNMPCNQRCIMCVPNGRHASDVMPLEQFQRLFQQIRPYVEHITLIGGEPLLYPWIDEVLELLRTEPVAVSINTNVTLLRPATVDRLLSLHELHLRASIDAATRETYRRIRGSDSFERVVRHLEHFGDRAATRSHVFLVVNYVVMRENLVEVLPFLELARRWRPHRIEFHPVRHVREWHVSNNTGWTFDGQVQSCEAFREEYNDVMRQAELQCAKEGQRCEVNYL
ncbi:MAG TPA: radical SAM protein [Candidatus Xenobia bacterium]|jgi:molybdenum cofactor biosynthesis enzyme MoaA